MSTECNSGTPKNCLSAVNTTTDTTQNCQFGVNTMIELKKNIFEFSHSINSKCVFLSCVTTAFSERHNQPPFLPFLSAQFGITFVRKFQEVRRF